METKQTQIGDYQYRVRQFGAQQGLRVLSRIGKLGGPSIASSLVGMPDAMAVGTLLQSIGPNDIFELAQEFAQHTEILVLSQSQAGQNWIPHGKLADQFDGHFADRYDHLAEFLAFAFVVNFERSINRGKGSLRERLLAVLAPLMSPRTSTGSSSGSSQPGGTS